MDHFYRRMGVFQRQTQKKQLQFRHLTPQIQAFILFLPFFLHRSGETLKLQLVIRNLIFEFSLKDYVIVFRNHSSVTTSQDLKKGVDLNLLTRKGDKSKTNFKHSRSLKKRSINFARMVKVDTPSSQIIR